MSSPQNAILDLMQYKGTHEILHQLRVAPQKYNRLKQHLSQQISARTLDHRLKELTEASVIEKITMPYSQRETLEEYQLSITGMVLEASYNAIYKLGSDLNFQNFLDMMKSQQGFYHAKNWKYVWEHLKQICREKGTIHTLSSRNIPNKILQITESGIEVESTKGIDTIEVGKIKTAYQYLMTEGRLYRQDHEKASYRSSFVCALLSQLDWVEVDNHRPLSIKVRKES